MGWCELFILKAERLLLYHSSSADIPEKQKVKKIFFTLIKVAKFKIPSLNCHLMPPGKKIKSQMRSKGSLLNKRWMPKCSRLTLICQIIFINLINFWENERKFVYFFYLRKTRNEIFIVLMYFEEAFKKMLIVLSFLVSLKFSKIIFPNFRFLKFH